MEWIKRRKALNRVCLAKEVGSEVRTDWGRAGINAYAWKSWCLWPAWARFIAEFLGQRWTPEAPCQTAYAKTHWFPYTPNGLPTVSAFQCLIFPNFLLKKTWSYFNLYSLVSSELSDLILVLPVEGCLFRYFAPFTLNWRFKKKWFWIPVLYKECCSDSPSPPQLIVCLNLLNGVFQTAK